jgi:bacteriorhodopsin
MSLEGLARAYDGADHKEFIGQTMNEEAVRQHVSSGTISELEHDWKHMTGAERGQLAEDVKEHYYGAYGYNGHGIPELGINGRHMGQAGAAVDSFRTRFLEPKWVHASDPVGVSFWIISIAMVASTVFFLWEAQRLGGHWRVSLTTGSLVTLVAAVHYFYMREFWVSYYRTPTVYRYIDWCITVPLQMIEFYLILRSVGPCSAGIFWRLLVGTVIMLLFGYMGESGAINAWVGFICGVAGWAYICNEIFNGEAGKMKTSADTPKSVQSAFDTMRTIVTLGWCIYPLGYFFGFLTGAVSAPILNFIYNIADFINKIAFVLAIWSAAISELEG